MFDLHCACMHYFFKLFLFLFFVEYSVDFSLDLRFQCRRGWLNVVSTILHFWKFPLIASSGRPQSLKTVCGYGFVNIYSALHLSRFPVAVGMPGFRAVPAPMSSLSSGHVISLNVANPPVHSWPLAPLQLLRKVHGPPPPCRCPCQRLMSFTKEIPPMHLLGAEREADERAMLLQCWSLFATRHEGWVSVLYTPFSGSFCNL